MRTDYSLNVDRLFVKCGKYLSTLAAQRGQIIRQGSLTVDRLFVICGQRHVYRTTRHISYPQSLFTALNMGRKPLVHPPNQLSIPETLQSLTPSQQTLFQANALTNAYYDMTSLQKNILYMVQAQIKRDDSDDRVYTIWVKNLMAITDTTNMYRNLQMATEGMMQKIMNIPIDGKLLQVAPFSSVLYDYGNGSMQFRIDPALRPFLFNLDSGRFTTFGKEPAMNLTGKYSKRIYEMLSSWKNAGMMKISVQELKTRLRLYDPITLNEQYMDWRDFNRRVLASAVAEINEKSDLRVVCHPRREGRLTTQLQFVIKVVATVVVEPIAEPSELHARLTGEFKQRNDQTLYILANFTPEEINKKLYEINLNKTNNRVTNLGAYTAKIFGADKLTLTPRKTV